MKCSVDDIVFFFENEFADIRLQADWDFSGKQIYFGNLDVSKICLSLDPTSSVVDQAIASQCELLITHHPIFLKPQRGIFANTPSGDLLVKAIKNNLTIISYHTNLDISPFGLNNYLLDILDANAHSILHVEGEKDLFKVIVYTPNDKVGAIQDAVFRSGGGNIGNYSDCSYSSQGIGTFKPNSIASPYIGRASVREEVSEVKQEFIVDGNNLDSVISAVRNAHPYETPAIDVIKLHSGMEYGFGLIGNLGRKTSFFDFLNLIKTNLRVPSLVSNFDSFHDFDTFAVCSGSGGTLWRDCLKKGVKVLLTGDLKHHDALDAREAGVCIIDAGHYYTERIYMEKLADIIKRHFSVEVFIANEKASLLYL